MKENAIANSQENRDLCNDCEYLKKKEISYKEMNAAAKKWR